MPAGLQGMAFVANIGGTAIKLAVFEGNAIFARDRSEVDKRTSLRPLLDDMAERWPGIAGRLEHHGSTGPPRIGLAFAGLVDGKAGRASGG